ncbi:MAG: hypothetical protein H7844_12145 [Nitrospirae bacterium YQR-1]
MNRRVILLCFLVLYFVLFSAVLIHYNDFTTACSVFGMYASKPVFGDLNIIACSMECLRKGMDLSSKTVHDLCGGYFNYTKFSTILVYTGINTSHTNVISVVLIAVYFFIIFRFIGDIDSFGLVVYCLLLYSPALMLLVERVNIDMLIFIALYASLFFLRKNKAIISYLIILFFSFIKLYPIFSFSVFLKKGIKHNGKMFVIMILFFACYLFLIRDEFAAIYTSTGRGVEYSYGALVFIDTIYPYLGRWGISSYVPFTAGQFHILAFLATLLIISTGVSKGLSAGTAGEDTEHIDGLRLGAGLYLGTFLIGNNWVYRLCFILFTVPQILIWCKSSKALKSLSILALAGIIVNVYNELWLIRMFVNLVLLTFIKEILSWYLVFYYSYAIARTIPNSIRNHLSLSNTIRAVKLYAGSKK